MAEFEIEEEGQEAEGTIAPEKSSEVDDNPSEIESLATELGWRPKDEFSGDDFIDAAMYIRKSRDIQDTMKSHIKEQKQQLAEMNNSVAELKTHNERVYKAEVSRLQSEVESLKNEKRTAIEDGDIAKVDELDKKIDGLKESMVEPKPETAKTTANPEFEDWVKDNGWYLKDPEMAAYADTIADKHTGAPFKRLASLVTNQVKEMFPDKFPANRSTPTVSSVESAGRKTTTKFTKADLTDGQKSIMKQFVRQGIMTEKQYIEDIKKLEGAA